LEQDYLTSLITLREKKEGKVLDRFKAYGYEEGVLMKLMDNKSPNLEKFEFKDISEVAEGGDRLEIEPKNRVDKDQGEN